MSTDDKLYPYPTFSVNLSIDAELALSRNEVVLKFGPHQHNDPPTYSIQLMGGSSGISNVTVYGTPDDLMRFGEAILRAGQAAYELAPDGEVPR